LKKLLISLMAVLVCAGMIGSSLAYFTDVETSAGNTFTAGTLDLKVGDNNESFRDGVTLTWTMTNMIPGVSSFGPRSVNLENIGTVDADHVEISFSNEINDLPDVESDTNKNSIPGEIARWIEIIRMEYDDNDWVSDFIPYDANRDPNNNGFFDLEDVTLPPYTDIGGFLDNLKPVPPPEGNGYTSFTMTLKFNAGATNDIQGDTLITTVYFTLNQVASQ
jgi:spore coat-associated protein N